MDSRDTMEHENPPTPLEEAEMADLDTGHPGDSSSESFFSSEDAESPNHSRNDYQYMSILDHSNYLSNALSSAMESIELDKSLALQAQLSGNLNNERQRLVDKQAEVLAKLQHIQTMYNRHFRPTTDTRGSHSRISTLESEFSRIEGHIHRLKYGKDSSHLASLFKTKAPGIVDTHPVEYNRARDKVLERQIDENDS